MDSTEDPDKLLVAAQAAHRAGRLEQAASVYQKLLGLDRDHADAHYGLGTVFTQQRDSSRAIGHLECAVALEPEVPEFLFNLALALDGAGETTRAKAACVRAAGLARAQPDMLAPICRKLLSLGMPGEACRALQASGSRRRDVLSVTAKAQAALGDWGGALRSLQTLTDPGPADAGVWRDLATAAAHLRDYGTALQAYDTYLSLTQPGSEDLLAHADLLMMAKRPEEARQAVESALERGVRHPEALVIAGRCARLDGRYDEARRYFLDALELRPAYGRAWQLLYDTLDSEELPRFAADGARLVASGAGDARDRVAIALIAGRALEALARYPEAFDNFRIGNEQHRALLEENGSAYDRTRAEAEFQRIRDAFPEAIINDDPAGATVRPLFVVGLPRSGTTLLERMLSCLDGVEGGGENEAMEFVATQYYWDLQHGRVGAPRELGAEAWRRLALEYCARTRAVDGLLVDKMPHNTRHVGLMNAMFPSAPIVYIRRDPRDVGLSIYSRVFPDGHRHACDLAWIAHYCAHTIRLMAHWQSVLGERMLTIDYETLVDEPAATSQAIAAFCRVDWHAGCLRFHENLDHSFTFSETQVRRPLNREGIGRWRCYETGLAPLIDGLREYGVL